MPRTHAMQMKPPQQKYSCMFFSDAWTWMSSRHIRHGSEYRAPCSSSNRASTRARRSFSTSSWCLRMSLGGASTSSFCPAVLAGNSSSSGCRGGPSPGAEGLEGLSSVSSHIAMGREFVGGPVSVRSLRCPAPSLQVPLKLLRPTPGHYDMPNPRESRGRGSGRSGLLPFFFFCAPSIFSSSGPG